MIRYADDFVVGFEYRHEAEAFDQALKARLARFGLEVAADKTKTLRFGHNGGPHNGRFDFLGFEFYWEPDRKGQPRVKRRTATKKWRAGTHASRYRARGSWKRRVRRCLASRSSVFVSESWGSCSPGDALRHMRERVDLKSPVREKPPAGICAGSAG